jgi:PAS domain S-box-containing protein
MNNSNSPYEALITSTAHGFCLLELIYEKGKAIDGRLLEVNEAFEQQTGLQNSTGRRIRELAPELDESWLEALSEVVVTGQPNRFERRSGRSGRVFAVNAARASVENRAIVAVIFDDVTISNTQRRWHEFLLSLNDAMRAVIDALDIQAVTSRLVMDFFGADRCYYCEIVQGQAIIRRDASRPDFPSVVGAYALDNLPILKAVIEQGKAFVVQDVRTTKLLDEDLKQLCLTMQILSFVNVPIIKSGVPVGMLCLTQSVPRSWQDIETQYAVEIAERTWAAVERSRAEIKLRESETQLRALVSVIPGLIWQLDASGQVVSANARWLEYTGQTLQQTCDGGWLAAIHPNEAADSTSIFQESFNTGQSVELEHRIRRFDGAYRWFLVRQEAVRGLSNEITSWFGLATDIHDRKTAEEERTWLAAIVESSSDAILSFDLSGLVISWNPGAEAVFGLPAAEQLGQSFINLAWSETKFKLTTLLQQLQNGEQVNQIDFKLVRQGKEPFDALITASPIRDAQGRIVAATAIVQDVTDRKRIERALAVSEARFRASVAQVRDHAIFSIDPSGIIITWNEGCRNVLGYEENEFIGLHSRHLFTPEDQQLEMDRVEFETAAQHGTANDDRWMMRRDGSRFYTSGTTNAVHGADGSLEGFIKVMRDLTERRLVEERLREVNEAQRRFVSDASHELRAPLMALGGNFEMLQLPNLNETDRTEIIRDLHLESARLSRLVNDLLAVARGDAGAPMKRERIQLDVLLSESWRLIRAFDKHTFQLGTLEPCEVAGDADRLKQLCLILLENAVKYTPHGGLVQLESSCQDGWAVVRIVDNGPGIEPADLGQVFERFYRADKARTPGLDPGGTGLGLPIARQIAEAHGGTVHLESALGSGTTAIMRVPLPQVGASD